MLLPSIIPINCLFEIGKATKCGKWCKTVKSISATKSIAGLRIHIERIVKGVRELHMLQQHSVVNNILTELDYA